MADRLSTKPGRGFWIIGTLGLVWNLLGVVSYILQVSMTPAELAAMQNAERLLYTDIPAWATGAYAIAVFGGSLGAAGLLLRKTWAVPVFAVSLLAIIVQMAHALFMTEAIEIVGPNAAIMPAVVIAIAASLLWYAALAKQKHWLN